MQKALIIGNGLIGGSLGMALTQKGKYIINYVDINKKYDNFFAFDKPHKPHELFDFQINCTGLKMPSCTYLKCIDISSFQYRYNGENIIFCHPLCGSEKSGRENARADLFKNQNCIITTEGKSQELIDFATDVFKEIGMNVFYCDTAEEHNKNLAYTSHLLHYLALNGFADLHPVLKRLSYSNKEMWDGIFEVNKKNIDKAMLEFCYNLSLCFHNQGIVASIRELVKDIPQHFYGTALKQLLNKN